MLDISVPFCTSDIIDHLNSKDVIEDPIGRIPVRVWAVLIFTFIVQLLERSVADKIYFVSCYVFYLSLMTCIIRLISVTSVTAFVNNSSVVRPYAYINAYIHTYIHTYTHTYIDTYLHTHIHTCIHTYIPAIQNFFPYRPLNYSLKL